MSPTPIALPPALPSELLEYVFTQKTYPTTLLICQPRTTFLSSLSKAVKHTSPQAPSEPLLNSSPSDNNLLPEEPLQRHSLLIPTLHQIATSRHINLVFVPTVTHLRAYLAVFPGLETKEGPLKQAWDKPGKKDKRPLLLVYGVVGLHKDTSEWSAQGLGNSLAGVVTAGSRTGSKVVVVEERSLEEDSVEVDEEKADDEDTESIKGRGCKVWEERAPMLNGSARRTGLESEEGGWSGRTVEVGRILARWFKFRKGHWDNGETG